MLLLLSFSGINQLLLPMSQSPHEYTISEMGDVLDSLYYQLETN